MDLNENAMKERKRKSAATAAMEWLAGKHKTMPAAVAAHAEDGVVLYDVKNAIAKWRRTDQLDNVRARLGPS